MFIHAPCKDCPDRVLGCHDTCIKYISYRKELDEFKEKERKRRKEEAIDVRHSRRKR